jgi:tRNA-splicing ligase RtcB
MSKITSTTNNGIANTFDTNTTFFTKGSNYPIKKISEFQFIVEKDTRIGMKVPVKIYANKTLISSMVADRTILQAINVSTLLGVRKHVVVLPD